MTMLILGAVAMASLVASLFFLRFWRDTRDRFFLLFALAFGLDAVSRVLLAFIAVSDEDAPLFYLLRLVMFALIIIAVIDKNRKGNRDP